MKVDARFLAEDGLEVFTGNELLLKGCFETEGGVHFLGGYPGSPVAGYFDSLTQLKDLIKAKGVRAAISNNEALAAAMLNGTQLLPARGIIVMKSVGVHVAADALALGNLAGAHPEGGAIVCYGDDPWSDSTQVPVDSRYISRHLHIPIIEPSTPQEVKDFVDPAFKLSRMSELYAGFILTTNLADGGGTVRCKPNQWPRLSTRHQVELDTRAINLDKYVLLPPKTWWQEASLPGRFARAIDASRSLKLNQVLYPDGNDVPLGFVTSGLAHAYLVAALEEMDLLGEFPILKLGLTYPLDEDLVRGFAAQCRRIVVIEERRGFIEEQIAQVLLRERQHDRPAGRCELWGKQFPFDLEGIPAIQGLHPSMLIERLAPLIRKVGPRAMSASASARAGALDRESRNIEETGRADVSSLPGRMATFCPGCPHRDTASLCLEIKKRFRDVEYMTSRHKSGPVDLMFHGDTGCYTMLMYPPNTDLMHDYSGMGLGGGTGAGIDPFISNKQVVFMGDSTFFHSGQLAISQAIKLGQDITFVILDNRTTAMTGHQCTPGVEYDVLGQPTPGQDIDEIVRSIGQPVDIPVIRFDPEDRVHYRRLLEETFLADGVKVIVADKECGITSTRRRRREQGQIKRRKGYLPSQQFMNVNSEICRFCLACTETTGCPGLKHVETDYGRKIDTDLTWCVNDGCCERVGACSSFERVTVKRKNPQRHRVPELELDKIPEPAKRPMQRDQWRCVLAGFGGMGCGLAASIIVRAGHKDGYQVTFVDKKGLAIRNGGTLSQIVYHRDHVPATGIIPFGKADLLIGLDILEAARALDPTGRARLADKQRTAAVINTDKINTISGLMGREDFDPDELEAVIRRHTREDDFLARNISRICEKYLGSKLFANMMMLGFAFQKGLVPVSMHSIAWAIRDTIRTNVKQNLFAFNMGRKLVESPELFQGPPRRLGWRETLDERCRWMIRRHGGSQKLSDQLRQLAVDTIAEADALDEPLRRAFVVRLYDTMRWGGIACARRYAAAVARTLAHDTENMGFAVTRAVIHNLANAMLIKDAIFLAELSTSPEKYARDREKYNVNPANGDSIHYRHMWHIDVPGLDYRPRVTLRPWMLRVLRHGRLLRKLLPTWHNTEKQFLARYEQAVAAFEWKTPAEYQRQLAVLESARCMNCTNARCQDEGCPLGNEVPKWMQLVYQDRWQEAAEVLLSTNNFPEFTSRVCPGFCQQSCKATLNGYGVDAQQAEAQIIERAFAEGWVHPVLPAFRSGRRVAVVGAGPAGLAAAQQLARMGHDVTVFEKDDEPGGLLRYGIPPHRLDKALIDRRLKQLSAEGVTFRNGVAVGKDVSAQTLANEFDAVLLAIGAARPRNLDIPGREHKSVHFALDLLRQHNLQHAGKAVEGEILIEGRRAVVIGGGETGNDCIEALLAGGAAAVHQLEILSKPAGALAALAAVDQDQRVTRRWETATTEFVSQNGTLTGLRVASVRWVKTPQGPKAQPLAGSEATIDADLAVLAMGFEPAVPRELAEAMELKLDQAGRLVLRDHQTSIDNVFAAGDCVAGASYVATAIASGRQAAKRIDAYLADAQAEQEAEAAETVEGV
jgi:indolepyruvate ferredoxin oxidoreductase